MKRMTQALSLALLCVAAGSAQEGSRFTGAIGGGFSQPVGNTGRHLDQGWNIQGGAGFNFNPYVGAMVDLGYNRFGINSTTLSNIGVPGGSLSVFSATLNPIVHLNPHGHFDAYLTVGGGLYHRVQEFTQPGIEATVGFDPFFGFFPAAVPVTQVLAEYSVNKPGLNVGAGFSMGTRWHAKFFAEARYHRIFIGNYHTDYVPVTFGIRW